MAQGRPVYPLPRFTNCLHFSQFVLMFYVCVCVYVCSVCAFFLTHLKKVGDIVSYYP